MLSNESFQNKNLICFPDALHAVDRGITKLFGVDTLIEGPMFPPVSEILTDPGFEESLKTGYFGQETSPGFVEEFPRGQNYNNQEDLEMSRAIEASLLDSHNTGRNIEGEQEFYGRHAPESTPFENQLRQKFYTSEKTLNIKDGHPLREDDFGSLRVEEEMAMSIDNGAAFSDTEDADLHQPIRESLLERDKHEAGGNEVRNEAEKELSKQKIDTTLLERRNVKVSLRDNETKNEANKELGEQEGIETESDEDPANARSERTQPSADVETDPNVATHPDVETHPRVSNNGNVEDTSSTHEGTSTCTDHRIDAQGNQNKIPIGTTDKHLRKSTQTVTGSRNSQETNEDQDSGVKHKENKMEKEENSTKDSELFKLIEASEKKKSIDDRHGHIDGVPAPQEKGAVQSPDQNSSGGEKSRISERIIHENDLTTDAERKSHIFGDKTEPENLQTRTSSSSTSTNVSDGITDESLIPSAENSAETAQNNKLEVSSSPTFFKTKFILCGIFSSQKFREY